MAKSKGDSATDMEALFGHALIKPKAKTGEGQAEERAARELGVQVLDKAHVGPIIRTWKVRDASGKAVAMVTLADAAGPSERERFAKAVTDLEAAGDALEGVLPVRAVSDSRDAFLTDLWTTGTARDLPALRWPLEQRVSFVASIARAVQRLHEVGLVHGCLCLDNVVLDDDLAPHLSEATLIDVVALAARKEDQAYEPYVAPEVKADAPANASADLYALGVMLRELGGDDATKSAAVTAIVRRCVSPPMGRYADAGELIAALDAAAEALRERTASPATGAMAPRAPTPAAAARTERNDAPVGPQTYATTPSAPWKPPVSFGVGGAIAAAAGLGIGALLGGGNDAMRTLLGAIVPAGAALATTLLPPIPRRENLGRALLAFGVLALTLVADPLSLAYRLAARSHVAGGGTSRQQAIAEILRMGRDFRGVSLAQAELTGLDMAGADLRGVDVSGANLTNARLFAAEVDGANFDGANLTGTDLTRTQLTLARLGSARCDGTTHLPESFACVDGRVDRARPTP